MTVALAPIGLECCGVQHLLRPGDEVLVADLARADPAQSRLDYGHPHLVDAVAVSRSKARAKGVAQHLGVALCIDLDALAVLEVIDLESAYAVDVIHQHCIGGPEAIRNVCSEIELRLHEQLGVRVLCLGLEIVAIYEIDIRPYIVEHLGVVKAELRGLHGELAQHRKCLAGYIVAEPW